MLAVARGDGERACAALQSAATAFRADRQPYETAQALLWMSRARLLTGEPALAERDLARAPRSCVGSVHARGGSAPRPQALGPLTAREAEVLECVAAGAGNREAAAQLFISEKTVGRHLANVYVKLGVELAHGRRRVVARSAGAEPRDRLHESMQTGPGFCMVLPTRPPAAPTVASCAGPSAPLNRRE